MSNHLTIIQANASAILSIKSQPQQKQATEMVLTVIFFCFASAAARPTPFSFHHVVPALVGVPVAAFPFLSLFGWRLTQQAILRHGRRIKKVLVAAGVV